MFFRKLFGRGSTEEKRPDATAELRWIEVGEEPFPAIRVIDLRPITTTMTSTTQNPEVAAYYSSRDRSGERFRGQSPPNSVTVSCSLRYPVKGSALPEGPVALSRSMEEKWDIFHFDGRLIFVRSWIGAVSYVATVAVSEGQLTVSRIEADGQGTYDSEDFVQRSVDYLIKSHVFGQMVPNPIPPDIPPDNPQAIALSCFSWYGRRAWFGSYDDTTTIKPGDSTKQ